MVYNMFSYVLCEIVCLVNSIGGKVEHEGQKKKNNLRYSRIHGQNGPEINKK